MEEFDFVVGSLQGSGRDGVVVPVEDSFAVGLQCAGKLHQLPDPAGCGGGDPAVEDDAGGGLVLLHPDLGEVFLEVVGRGQRLVQLEGLLQSLAFVAFRIEVGGVLHEQPTCPLQDLLLELIGGLAMEFAPGEPIETLQVAPQAVRDRTMTALLGLVLRELFAFGYMQTDPNFANYRWQADTGRIVLLDFGAARAVPSKTVEAYRRLMRAGLADDRDAVLSALIEVGFISTATLQRHRRTIDDMVDLTLGRVGRPGAFDFSDRSFVGPLLRQSETIIADRGAWHVPPANTLFVQRKISGMALLAIRMQARAPLRDMVSDVLAAGCEQAQREDAEACYKSDA